MKKILYIVEATSISGAGICAQELVSYLKNNSNYIPIVITQFSNDINDFCKKNGIENYALHYARTCSMGMGILGWLIAFLCRPFLNVLAFYKLKSYINFNQIALIHSNAVSIDFGAYIHKKTNIPHIWHIRDFLIFDGIHKSIINNFTHYLNHYSTKIITVSNKLNSYCVNHGCATSKVQTIYDCVKSQNSKAYNPDQKIQKIVCIGNISPLKGQFFLIESIAKLPKEETALLHIDFYGYCDNDYLDEIITFIKKQSLEKVFSFNGFCTNVQEIIKNYDIGIQPSHSEGFSLVTAEYMMAGLCIIAANEGAIPELIQHEKNGLLYEDYNSTELCNCILRCIKNPEEASILGKKAHQDAIEKYTQERCFNEIINVYNKFGQ